MRFNVVIIKIGHKGIKVSLNYIRLCINVKQAENIGRAKTHVFYGGEEGQNLNKIDLSIYKSAQKRRYNFLEIQWAYPNNLFQFWGCNCNFVTLREKNLKSFLESADSIYLYKFGWLILGTSKILLNSTLETITMLWTVAKFQFVTDALYLLTTILDELPALFQQSWWSE